MKVNAVNQADHLRLENRVHTMARADARRDDRVKTVRADNVQAEKNTIVQKRV